MNGYTRSILSLLLPIALSGCLAAAIAGTGATAYSAAQERTIGNALDDTTIYTKIKALYLEEDVNELFHSVAVEVQEGRVLLTGQVSNAQHRVEAVRLAWQPFGVQEVINEIQISDKTSIEQYARDAFITAQIRAKLLIDGNVRSINYSLDTVNNIVYIMGIARDEAELNRVTEVASKVKGVKKVISHARLRKK